MLKAYVQSAKEACSAEQPHLLIGGSFDIGKALMDNLLCDLSFPLDILVNDARQSARDYALVTRVLRCSSGGLPDRQSGVVTDVRILLEDEPIEDDDPSTDDNEPPPKKPRTSAVQPGVFAVKPLVRTWKNICWTVLASTCLSGANNSH